MLSWLSCRKLKLSFHYFLSLFYIVKFAEINVFENVFDISFREATLIPVYEGVPILKSWQAQPLAGAALQVMNDPRYF